ncbi:hypothetical protein JEM62_19970 [Bacillus atrophaeus]|nr:hypothetical protein [Bacillus atrophaeus]
MCSWCEQISEEELLKSRTGGMGSILKTRFHVIDGEISWIYEILGEKVFHSDYVSLKASAIKQLSMDYQLR